MFPKKGKESPSKNPMHQKMETKKIEKKELKTGKEQMPKKMVMKLKKKVMSKKK